MLLKKRRNSAFGGGRRFSVRGGAGKAAAPWTPASMAGIVGRFAPGDFSYDTTATWTDSIGSIGDATATGTLRPTASTRGGQDSVLFDGTNDSMAITAFSSISQPFTLIVVCDSTVAGVRYALGGNVASSGIYEFSASTYGFWGANLNGGAQGNAYMVVFDGASSEIYVDDMTSAAASGNTGAASGLTDLQIGATIAGGSTWGGHINEVIVLDQAIATADKARLNTYLADTYTYFP